MYAGIFIYHVLITCILDRSDTIMGGWKLEVFKVCMDHLLFLGYIPVHCIALSVCVSVGHKRELCQNSQFHRKAV